MLAAAANIYKELIEKNIINDQLGKYPDYKIVVTGHSLGAGVAAILGFFIRSDEKIKHLVKVYAYGVPGGLLNSSARNESKKFAMSIIHGDDMIPRLSIRSLKKLHTDIRKILIKTKVAKYKIISYGFLDLLKSLFCCYCCIPPRDDKVSSSSSNPGLNRRQNFQSCFIFSPIFASLFV